MEALWMMQRKMQEKTSQDTLMGNLSRLYTVIKPACTREEMFEVLRRHYKIGEGESYEAIGELLGCSEKTARTRKLIDTETYNAIKDKVEINSPPVPQKGRQMWKSNRQDEFDPGGCS